MGLEQSCCKKQEDFPSHRLEKTVEENKNSCKVIIYALNDVYETENFPKVATFIEDHKNANQCDLALITMAGDFLSPSLLSNVDSGELMVKCMNALQVDYTCLGNHEFDLPVSE